MAAIPHFRLPFRIGSMGADTVEQDSDDEIGQCVSVLLATEAGSRIEVPEFGIPGQIFVAETAVQTAAIEAQCARWEPRILTTIESQPDMLDEMLRTIRAKMRTNV